ncbi:MAG: hypothetical protein FJ278_22050 [Planctomycetes bacterium]|nr:hypothetical protein [Planctomycetota bacterium]
MPNVVSVLKAEIVRISRKEAKAAVTPIRGPSVKVRHDVASLKKRMAALEKANRELQVVVARLVKAQPEPAVDQGAKARITAKGMRSLRRHLRLSGKDFARLLGVTGQAVYNWDKRSGTLKVRAGTRAAILALRGIGAREAKKRLAEMAAKKPKASRRGRKTARRR